MFKITRNSTISTITISPQSISVPCFQLTNYNTNLTNFSPMFKLEHINEVVETVDDFMFFISTLPSQYQILELDILSPSSIDDLGTLYFNGSEYQNLLSVDEFSFISSGNDNLVEYVDTLSVEEREST
jgi:hypothetical protein